MEGSFFFGFSGKTVTSFAPRARVLSRKAGIIKATSPCSPTFSEVRMGAWAFFSESWTKASLTTSMASAMEIIRRMSSPLKILIFK